MTIQSLLGTIVIALFVITFATQAFQIPSESMENTLLVGEEMGRKIAAYLIDNALAPMR